jgi:hypothetical protein
MLSVATSFVIAGIAGSVSADNESPLMVGWAERIVIRPGNFIIPAKVDTGADACSLHAYDLSKFDRDGKKYVRFKVVDGEGKERTLERKVIGVMKITRHFGGLEERPVVRLRLCLANVYKKVKVNLVDRTGLEYPMLIGRNFMEGDLAVNPSVKFTTEPRCAVKRQKDRHNQLQITPSDAPAESG